MSATWRTVPVACVCGGCGAAIAAGLPVCQVQVLGVRRRLLRCPTCAGGPPLAAPAVVDAPPARAPLPFGRFTVAALPFDWKARASGDREPGEEG